MNELATAKVRFATSGDNIRRAKIERLKRDIVDIGSLLEVQREQKRNVVGWIELAQEKSRLEDEVALKEAELKHNEFTETFSLLSSIGRAMQTPDKTALLRGEVERRKKRIKEIEEILGRNSMPHPESSS